MKKTVTASPAALETIRDTDLAAACGGRASVSDLTITKRIDVASAKLFTACATGTHIPEVKL